MLTDAGFTVIRRVFIPNEPGIMIARKLG